MTRLPAARTPKAAAAAMAVFPAPVGAHTSTLRPARDARMARRWKGSSRQGNMPMMEARGGGFGVPDPPPLDAPARRASGWGAPSAPSSAALFHVAAGAVDVQLHQLGDGFEIVDVCGHGRAPVV